MSMTTPITASMPYNLEACPHRASMDQHGDSQSRGEVIAFANLYGRRGVISS